MTSNVWVDKHHLLIRITQKDKNEPEFMFRPKIAAFNLDNTLIKPKFGNKYKSSDDWKLCNKSIMPKLIELDKKEFSLVVLSNLPDTTKNPHTKIEFQKRFDNFCKLLFNKKIPIIGFFSIKKNFCHKPYTGMWKLLEAFYKVNNMKIPNKKQCVYVGGLAGRPFSTKTYKYNKRSSDNSCVDRAFAYNISIKFYTPERYFMKEYHARESQWKYQDPILTKEERLKIREESKNIGIEDPFRHGVRHALKRLFPGLKQFLVIIIGPPTSSKTTLANHIVDQTESYVLEKKICPWTLIDPLSFSKIGKIITKCTKKVSDEIIHGNSVIIDGCSHTIEQREKYINIVRRLNTVGILLIELSISPKISKQLNCMRVELSNDFNLMPIGSGSYTRYYKDFQNPINAEFRGIPSIRWKILKYPFILIDIKEWWYIFDKWN